MSIRFSHALLSGTVAACFAFAIGCSQPSQDQPPSSGGSPTADGHEEYNPHDVPITEEQKTELRQQTERFADAVAKVKELRNAVEAETKNGIPENPHKAHQALDKADLLLQWLPQIARNSDVPKEHWETINTSANDLRTLFEQVHQNIDNQQDPNFAAVAAQIDEKITGLQAIATAEAASADR